MAGDPDAKEISRLLAEARKFVGSAARTAFALQENVRAFVERVGLERCGFVGLTFGGGGDGPSCREATKKFNSFLTGALRRRYPGGIRVLERGEKRGRVHFHLLADVGRDIRTGVDVDAVQRGDYRTASVGMREEYIWLRRMAQRYGFGFVVNIQPVKSCAQAIARYLSKYVSKHIGRRELRDRGTRLVGYWGHARTKRRVCSSRFSFHSPKVQLYRWQKGEFARRNGCADLDALKEKFGPRVDYWQRGEIMLIEPPSKVVRVHKVPDQEDEWLTLWDVWFQGRKETAGAVAVAVGCTPAEAYAHIYQTDLLAAEPIKSTPEGAAQYRRIVARECEQLDADLAALDEDGEPVDVTRIWRDGRVEKVVGREARP